MKNTIHHPHRRNISSLHVLALCCIGLLLCGGLVTRQSFGQQTSTNAATDVPHVISYQGVLANAAGQPVSDGKYSVTATLYSDAQGSGYVWQDKFTVDVKGGVFSVLLGSGSSRLPRLVSIDQPLWVGIAVGSQPELRPLTQLASVPYALNVADNSITPKKLSGEFVGSITVDKAPISIKDHTLDLHSGSGIDLNYDKESNSLSFNLSNQTAKGVGPHPQMFIGAVPPCTVDNVAATDAVGFPSNSTVGSPIIGAPGFASMLGGWGNNATGDYSTLGGGAENNALGCGSVVVGGGIVNGNCVAPPPGCPAPPGPWFNGNTANGFSSAIVGGISNKTNFNYNFIGGGDGNTTGSDWSVVAGGKNNTAGSPMVPGITAAVCGGEHNQALADGAAICGGEQNTANDIHSSITGGFGNTTLGPVGHQHIGGGMANTANAGWTTICGGQMNTTNQDWAFVGGGNGNIAGGVGPGFGITQTVAGGDHNFAYGDGAAICGGEHNTANDIHSSITGGIGNTTLGAMGHQHIGGGGQNTANNGFTTIGGGQGNTTNADYSAILGGSANTTGAKYSVASGLQAQTQQYGQHAQASGALAAAGDAQTSVYVERGTTLAGGPAVNLTLDGSGLPAGELVVPPNFSMSLRIEIIARDNAVPANSQSFFIDGMASYNNPGPNACVVTGPVTAFGCFPIPGAAIAVVPVAGTNIIRITVNAASPSVNWVARIQTAEVKL